MKSVRDNVDDDIHSYFHRRGEHGENLFQIMIVNDSIVLRLGGGGVCRGACPAPFVQSTMNKKYPVPSSYIIYLNRLYFSTDFDVR